MAFRYDLLGSTYYGSLAAQKAKETDGRVPGRCERAKVEQGVWANCGEHPKPPRGDDDGME
jgi:hypothetical protein